MKWILAGLMFLAACAVDPLVRVEQSASISFELPNGSCTATMLEGGYVLTAGHCATIDVATAEGERAYLVWRNRYYDVAVYLAPTLVDAPHTTLACRPPRLGEKVIAIANMRDLEPGTITFGRIGHLASEHVLWKEILTLNIAGAPGSSGAPVFDTTGRVIAMIVGGVTPYSSIVFAVPSEVICALIEGNGVIKDEPPTDEIP